MAGLTLKGILSQINTNGIKLDFPALDTLLNEYNTSIANIQNTVDNYTPPVPQHNKAPTGYTYLSSGYIMQMGVATAGGGWITQTLPVAFPNNFSFVVPVHINSSCRLYNTHIISNSQFTIQALNVISYATRYLAIGY